MTEKNWFIDEVMAALERGELDTYVPHIDRILQERQQIIARWRPIEDLTEMVRRIDAVACDTAEKRAQLGGDLMFRLRDGHYLDHADPAVRGLATGVRVDVMTRLMGVPADRAAELFEPPTTPSESPVGV